jgi:hypothetical protein
MVLELLELLQNNKKTILQNLIKMVPLQKI